MNNTSDFLLYESQLKKLQHTVSFFNISTAIFLVVNLLTWSYLIVHASLILDGYLIAFIIGLIPIYAFVWLPMILIFFPLHFMKQKIKKLMLADGTKHTFSSKNMLKALLIATLCTGFFLLRTITHIDFVLPSCEKPKLLVCGLLAKKL